MSNPVVLILELYFFSLYKYNNKNYHLCGLFICGNISLLNYPILGKIYMPKDEIIHDERILKIANKIKQLRLQKGFSSHEQFAWQYNINRVQYWRIEKGSNITLSSLLKILDIHNITLNDFFKDL